jgi:recombination protein RecR
MDSPTQSNRLLMEAVEQLSKLPGIGRRTAMRLALHLLRQEVDEVEAFGQAFIDLRRGVRYCSRCHNLAEGQLCNICADPTREQTTICVVEDVRDVMAIEATGQYRGLYHVLGGIISPMDGTAPGDLNISSLTERAGQGTEIILALSATMEGETTGFYIYRQLVGKNINITTIARGVAVGGELEYADEASLGRSIRQRTPFQPGNS